MFSLHTNSSVIHSSTLHLSCLNIVHETTQLNATQYNTMHYNTEEQYKQMVLDKTGGLFRLAVGLMLAFSEVQGVPRDYTCLLNRLSLYFQIRDDYLNISR